MPKYFVISLFFIFFMFSPIKIDAANYCHLFQDDTLYDTVTMPFYFHSNTMKWESDFSLMPHSVYHSSSSYISTATECERIKVSPIRENIDVLEKFNITYYDYTDAPYSEELTNFDKFANSKFKNSNTIIKGFFSIEDLQPPTFYNYLDKYTTNINNPISLESIIKSINIYDKRDGNVKDNLTVIYDSYTENKHQPGTYLIVLSASDYSNNTSPLSINIEVIDTSPPSIEGINYYKSYLSSPITIAEIKDNIQVYDNSKSNIIELEIYEENYLSFNNKPGIYFVSFYAKDSSYNISDIYTVTIEIIDDIKPTIEGKNYYTTSISNPLPIENISYSLIALDNDNTNLSSSIYISKDEYTKNKNTLGEKSIYFQVMDTQGNTSESFCVTINIIDDTPPSIYGLNNFTSYLSNPLSSTYIKQQLTVLDNYDGDLTNLLKITDDSYSNNLNNIGTYYITFEATDLSNNISNAFVVSITNIDDLPPVIHGPSYLQYEYKHKPTLNELLYNYQAIDNVEGICELIIDYDSYSTSSTTGTYYLSIYSTDSNGNKSVPYKIQIDIKDYILNITKSTLYLPTSITYTPEEIAKLINLEKEYTIIKDTYTNNNLTPGTYNITYKIDDYNNVDITIITYQIKEETTAKLSSKEKKETLFDKIKSFFKKLFLAIKNFFTNLNIFQCYYKWYFYLGSLL